MKSQRKYIRIALTPDDAYLFEKTKTEMQKRTGVAMSDSAYALGIIRQQIEQKAFQDLLDGISDGKGVKDPF
jgi:hypothetical protein